MEKLPLEVAIERDVAERKERDEALDGMQQLVIDAQRERDEWRKLSGEWQKRAESLRDSMAEINSRAGEIAKTVETLQRLMRE